MHATLAAFSSADVRLLQIVAPSPEATRSRMLSKKNLAHMLLNRIAYALHKFKGPEEGKSAYFLFCRATQQIFLQMCNCWSLWLLPLNVVTRTKAGSPSKASLRFTNAPLATLQSPWRTSKLQSVLKGIDGVSLSPAELLIVLLAFSRSFGL